jgi:hypothetical protein
MMKELKRLLAEREVSFHSNDNRIMCFPHVVNIATQNIIRALTNPDLMDDDEDENEADNDEDNSDEDNGDEVNGDEDNGDEDNSDEEDDDEQDEDDDEEDEDDQGQRGNNMLRKGASNYQDACRENPIDLCRQIARTVRSSGQRRDDFDEMITKGNIKGWFKVDGQVVQVSQLQLLLDVKTRWDSTFTMMKRFIELQPVCIVSAAL